MANKITKKDYFKMAIAETSNPELIAFFNHEIELLEKKNSGTRKPDAKQVANENLRNEILSFMEDGKAYTVTEIQKAFNIESNQRASALIRQLKDACLVTRTVEKGKAYFTKAQEDLKKSSQKPLDKITKMVYYKSVKREVLPNFLSLPLINQLRCLYSPLRSWLMSGQTSPTKAPFPPLGAFCFELPGAGRCRPEFHYTILSAICQAKI